MSGPFLFSGVTSLPSRTALQPPFQNRTNTECANITQTPSRPNPSAAAFILQKRNDAREQLSVCYPDFELLFASRRGVWR